MPKNRLGKPVYTRETVNVPERIRAFHWYKCGSYLAEYIRENIDALQQSRAPDYHYEPMNAGGKHSAAEARQPVFMYLEAYCNRLRAHSAPGYVSPNVFYLGRAA